jgi:hypothetical protein
LENGANGNEASSSATIYGMRTRSATTPITSAALNTTTAITTSCSTFTRKQ